MASIVAKVTRDRMMEQLETEYPGYGFARHKVWDDEHRDAVIPVGVPWSTGNVSAETDGRRVDLPFRSVWVARPHRVLAFEGIFGALPRPGFIGVDVYGQAGTQLLDRVLGRLDTLDSVISPIWSSALARERDVRGDFQITIHEGILVISAEGRDRIICQLLHPGGLSPQRRRNWPGATLWRLGAGGSIRPLEATPG